MLDQEASHGFAQAESPRERSGIPIPGAECSRAGDPASGSGLNTGAADHTDHLGLGQELRIVLGPGGGALLGCEQAALLGQDLSLIHI